MPYAIIPQGSTGVEIILDDGGVDDTINIFTRSGEHLAGIQLANWYVTSQTPADPLYFMTENNGFSHGAVYDNSMLNGNNSEVNFTSQNDLHDISNTIKNISMKYTGDGSRVWPFYRLEKLTINNVTEDLILIIAGRDGFSITTNWNTLGTGGGTTPGTTPTTTLGGGTLISIATQEKAQKALERIDAAIVQKDKVRAHLGALQNRFENTITNLSVQAENLQAAESRISDTDVAVEMTEFVRNQILSQSATAMLAQANSLPQMLAGLLEG